MVFRVYVYKLYIRIIKEGKGNVYISIKIESIDMCVSVYKR